MGKLVFVYGIQRQSAFGVDQWVSASGVNLKKSKIGTCSDTLKCLYSASKGGLANYISYTPWVEDGKPKLDEKGNPLMLQHKLELKWGKPHNYFTNEPLGKGDNKPDHERTYFQRMSWKMTDGCTVFDLDTLDGEMGYYMLLGSSKCANSEKEWRQHMWPKAEWYIALENESESIKAQKNTIKVKAYAALSDSGLTDTYRRKFISLLDISDTRSTLTTEQVNNLLVDYIDKSSYTTGSNIDKFNELYNLLTTATGREEIEARYLLAQAIDARVIQERAGSYTWNRAQGAIVIGERFSEAVDFIMNPKKSPEVEQITVAIKLKNS
jgi:hypothetical protein